MYTIHTYTLPLLFYTSLILLLQLTILTLLYHHLYYSTTTNTTLTTTSTTTLQYKHPPRILTINHLGWRGKFFGVRRPGRYPSAGDWWDGLLKERFSQDIVVFYWVSWRRYVGFYSIVYDIYMYVFTYCYILLNSIIILY